jgi:hypothetical protein
VNTDSDVLPVADRHRVFQVFEQIRHVAAQARKTAYLQRGQAERTSEVAWKGQKLKGQKRLCSRHRLLEARGKLKVQVSTATARELAGFIWAIAQCPAFLYMVSTEKRTKPLVELLEKMPVTLSEE